MIIDSVVHVQVSVGEEIARNALLAFGFDGLWVFFSHKQRVVITHADGAQRHVFIRGDFGAPGAETVNVRMFHLSPSSKLPFPLTALPTNWKLAGPASQREQSTERPSCFRVRTERVRLVCRQRPCPLAGREGTDVSVPEEIATSIV